LAAELAAVEPASPLSIDQVWNVGDVRTANVSSAVPSALAVDKVLSKHSWKIIPESYQWLGVFSAGEILQLKAFVRPTLREDIEVSLPLRGRAADSGRLETAGARLRDAVFKLSLVDDSPADLRGPDNSAALAEIEAQLHTRLSEEPGELLPQAIQTIFDHSGPEKQ
jgi:hypothetical protein